MKLLRVLTPLRLLAAVLLLLCALVLQLRTLDAGLAHPGGEVVAPRRVTLLTSFSIQDSARYKQAFAAFERDSGIEVTLRPAGGDFADHIQVATPGFDAPDIAVFAQPGLFRELVGEGYVRPLPDDLSHQVRRDFPAFLDPVLLHGQQRYGVWSRVAIKSLVWYRRALFEQHGLVVPRTDVELAALEQQMLRRKLTPWCIGIGARGATGWVATDWVEEFMLRRAGPGDYDRWVAGELPFNSAPVRDAFAAWHRMVQTPGLIAGGTQGMLDTQVEEAARRFASDPAPCLMMRNAEWVASEFPPSTPVGPADAIDFFILPGRSAAHSELLVAGDVAAALNDRPETMAVLRHIASAEYARHRAAAGAYLSAHADVVPDAYTDPLSARLARHWSDATVMRMDASDLMPGAIGTAAFWTGMVRHLKGAAPAEVAAGIDATWRHWRAQQALRPAAPAASGSRS